MGRRGFEMLHCDGCAAPASRLHRTADDVDLCEPCFDGLYIEGLEPGDRVEVHLARNPDEWRPATFRGWLPEVRGVQGAVIEGIGNMPVALLAQLRRPRTRTPSLGEEPTR